MNQIGRFFFQAEDGIRDSMVTGVQTCALPIFQSIDSIDYEQWEKNFNDETMETDRKSVV